MPKRIAVEVLDPDRHDEFIDNISKELKSCVVGQDHAVDQVVQAITPYFAGFPKNGQPIANLLFLGPTGTGKTLLVESAARIMLGDSGSVLKIDCGEFQHSHEVAKLIGSPPGYLGHRETIGILSQVSLNKHRNSKNNITFVLFDEIEKGHQSLWNMILGLLDKAVLTMGDNSTTDFTSSVIFMTSNLAAARMHEALSPSFGLAAGENVRDLSSVNLDNIGKFSARKKFTPEFMNRLDAVVTFKPLSADTLSLVCSLELSAVQAKIPDIGLLFTDTAKDALIAAGTDVKSGARELKRVIHRSITIPLARLVSTKQIKGGDVVGVAYRKEKFVFTKGKSEECAL